MFYVIERRRYVWVNIDPVLASAVLRRLNGHWTSFRWHRTAVGYI